MGVAGRGGGEGGKGRAKLFSEDTLREGGFAQERRQTQGKWCLKVPALAAYS